MNNQEKKPLVIIGVGGFAKELCAWLSMDSEDPIPFVFYDDDPKASIFNVESYNDFTPLKDHYFLIAVGSPKARKILWEKAIAEGLKPAPAFVSARATVGVDSKFGDGTIICPGSIVTSECTIGENVLMNLNATVGHDSIIGNHVVISPGANISGKCDVKEMAYIGTNSCIREGISVGKEAVVGMGAAIVKNVDDGKTMIGFKTVELSR